MPLSEMAFEASLVEPPFMIRLPSNLKKSGVFTSSCPSPLTVRSPWPSKLPFMVMTAVLSAMLSSVLL